jgi:eukaryotic-like serine/threonine-protein kinase
MASPTTTDRPPPLEEGAAPLPGYEVIDHLRRGAALDVYDAWSYERDCRCVIKLLRPDRRDDDGSRRRLLQEGWLACRLRHPHLVAGYEVVEEPQAAAVLETLDGETLSHLIRRSTQRLPCGDLAHLGMHLCSAMHYLHSLGFLHIDLKPSNVISEAGRAKVIDLSLARPPGQSARGAGTRSYMSPEQARGDVLTEAADVWGIGVVLYEAATGVPAYNPAANGPSYPQVDSPPPPISGSRRLPPQMRDAISSCLSLDPGSRPTVRELSDGLDPFG